jgi:hypothetical protein
MTTKRRRVLTVGLLVIPLLLIGMRAAMAAHPKNQTLPYGEVNWDRGYVRVSAVGLPPFEASGAPRDPEIARANAVSAAQKRLLGVLLELDAPDGQKLRERLAGHAEIKQRLREIVYAASVQGKTYSDGAVEVTLTVPLKGPAGLQTFIDTL